MATKASLSRASTPRQAIEILELPLKTTKSECQKAYRTLMALYHPDKVAHLGPELRKIKHFAGDVMPTRIYTRCDGVFFIYTVSAQDNSGERRVRLREFLRFNYMTGSQAARRIGVRDTTLYSRLQGHSRPRSAVHIIAFLESMPAHRGGIRPTGYEYREYKNWRGIPKPRRCPFCKKTKAEIRKVRGAFQGSCPNAALKRKPQ